MSVGCTISLSELNRIKSSLVEDVASQDKQKNALKLHERSKARASQWGNTLEGSRKKKAEDKRLKLEREEEARLKVDAEEAKIQLEKRRQTVEYANRKLWEDSDRLKSFHSRMMLSDVLAERDSQVKLKNELCKLDQIREERFLEMDAQNYRKMLERELREKEQKEANSKMIADSQKEQLMEFKKKKMEEIQDSILEGEMLRKKAAEDLQMEKNAEKRRKAQARVALNETQKANNYLKQVKEEEMIRQEKEEQRIEEYAAMRERMVEMRVTREKEVFRAKQAQRQKMIDAMAKQLMEIKSTEERRLENQVQEKEQAEKKKLEEKEALHAKMRQEMNQSRLTAMQARAKAFADKKQEEKETMAHWKDWCEKLDEMDAEEKVQRRNANRRLVQEQLKQCEMNRRRKKLERQHELEVVDRAKEALEADTLEFHAYAEHCIKEYAKDGKNVIPLIKELRDYASRE